MKIGRVRLTRVKGDDDPLMSRIDFHVVHTLDFHKWPAEFSESTVVILAFGSDFDRFQDRVIGAFWEKGIRRIWIVWSCRVHSFYLSNARYPLGGCLSLLWPVALNEVKNLTLGHASRKLK